jgi:hypothetical protein
VQAAGGHHLLVQLLPVSRISAMRRSFSRSASASSALIAWISGSGLPPSTMSVPRPAMLVAMVTWPGGPPAHDLGLARVLLRVQHVVRDLLLLEHRGDELGILHRRGADEDRLALAVRSFTSLMIAWYFSFAVMKTWSFRSLRTIGRCVGMSTVSRL